MHEPSLHSLSLITKDWSLSACVFTVKKNLLKKIFKLHIFFFYMSLDSFDILLLEKASLLPPFFQPRGHSFWIFIPC